jgi:hypothetical protein
VIRTTAVLLAAAGGLAAAVLVEIALRLAGLPAPQPSGWRSDPSLVPAAERNQLGFRGRRIEYSPGDRVVLVVGDSQVEALSCRFEAMPERRLEAHLARRFPATRVFSLGTAGYGQDQQLLVLREYLRLWRADMVLVWETPENDVWNNLFPTHWPAEGRPKPTFWLDEGRLAGPTEALGEDTLGSPRLLALVRSVLPRGRDRSWEERLPPAYIPFSPCGGRASDRWQERRNRGLGSMRDENLATEKSHLAMRLTPPSERMRYALDLGARLLGEMDATVRARGGRLAAFWRDYPDHWTLETSASGEEIHRLDGRCYRTSNAQFLENVSRLNRRVRHTFVPVTAADWRTSAEDVHLSEAGVDQVMRDLAETIVREPGLSRSSR